MFFFLLTHTKGFHSMIFTSSRTLILWYIIENHWFRLIQINCGRCLFRGLEIFSIFVARFSARLEMFQFETELLWRELTKSGFLMSEILLATLTTLTKLTSFQMETFAKAVMDRLMLSSSRQTCRNSSIETTPSPFKSIFWKMQQANRVCNRFNGSIWLLIITW